jgi:hypothetical protein
MLNTKNIGGYVKIVQGNAPIAMTEQAYLGSAIDRLGYDSCVLVANIGATAGAPTGLSFPVTIMHCATSGGTYATYVPTDSLVTAQISLATTDTIKALAVNLSGANRYLKVSCNPDFTAGTSPSLVVGTSLIFGGAADIPTTL